MLEKERSEAIANRQAPQDTFLGKACVYILFGAAEDGGKDEMAYIGESENVASRLLAHYAKKEFWNEAIILCRTDDDFNKGHIRYIERQLIDLAKKCDRYALNNDPAGTSNEKPFNSDDKSVADDFIDDIKALVEMLGYKIFTPLRESFRTLPEMEIETTDDIPTFYIIRGGAVIATGQPTNDGFVVFEGSQIAATESPSYPPKIKHIRDALTQDGGIADGKLTKDCVFPSPTGAGWAVLDNSAGSSSWKTPLESGVPPAECKQWKTFAEWRAEQDNMSATDALSE